MKTYYVVFSYDLKSPPGNHAKFKAEMEKLGWSFEIDKKPLPNTTCWKEYNVKDPATAEKGAELDVVKARGALTGTDAVVMDKMFFVAFPQADFIYKCY